MVEINTHVVLKDELGDVVADACVTGNFESYRNSVNDACIKAYGAFEEGRISWEELHSFSCAIIDNCPYHGNLFSEAAVFWDVVEKDRRI